MQTPKVMAENFDELKQIAQDTLEDGADGGE